MHRANIWEFLPPDILVEVFTYLSRRDLLACSLVCIKWKNALHTPSLWSNMVIHLDTDLMDPSTILLTRLYFMHIKSLELGWTNPQLPTRWLSYRFQEITKRACRYIIVLNDCYVQLETLKIHDWYEICRFKKIVYHLSLFLRSQRRLERVSFRNAYLNKTDFIRIFISCQNSEQTITYLDLRNCYYQYEQNVLSVQFVSIVAQLENLHILKVDYTTLCREVIGALLTSRNTQLKELVVYIQDDEMSQSIKEEAWESLREKCPNLKVAFHFKNISYSNGISFVLRKRIPLTTFTITCGRNLCYRNILTKIIKNYKNSLEVINFHIRDNHELLDDLLLTIIRSFPNLQSFEFCGIIESFELIQEICKYQAQLKMNNFKYFKLLPKDISAENQVYVSQVYEDIWKDKLEYNFDMKVRNARPKNIVLFYYC